MQRVSEEPSAMRQDASCNGLRSEREGSAVIFTIDRPEAGNAISLELARELRVQLAQAAKAKHVRTIILTGAGGRFFSSGGDLKRYSRLRTGRQLDRVFGYLRRTLATIEGLDKIVIAAIDGMALGGGAELSLACDLRIASRGALIGFPQARLGLSPAWHGARRLVELLGRGAAMRLLLSAEPVPAVEAQRIGLVDLLTVRGTALAAALEWTRRLDRAAPLALGAIKRVLLAAARQSPSRSARLEEDVFRSLWLSEDHREAERAFLQKRAPRFRGR
jgi:enoyl-CoA hydratase/carnithine racemase